MRTTLLLIIIFGSISIRANETRAQCTCPPTYVNITARNEFNLADAVFVGKVVEIKNTPREKDDRNVQTVIFQVTRAWKHDVNADFTITNTINGCIDGFEKNEEWLVYAYKTKDGTFITYCCCSRTRLLANADDDVTTFADDRPAKILPSRNSKP